MEPANLEADLIPAALAQADTPAARTGAFLDSAGSSLPPSPVLDAVLSHLRREAEIGGYRAAAEADLDAGYDVLAELLDCAPDEVAYTDSATRSWLTLLDAISLGPGDRVLTTEAEYGGNAIPLLHLATRMGFIVEPVPSGPDGTVDVDSLRSMVDERVKLVSLVHVPTNGGLVNPVEEVTAVAHSVGALVLLDACQSLGQLPVSLSTVDMITGTGRKWLRGPRGTGFLAVRREVLPTLRPRLIDLQGGQWTGPAEVSLRPDTRVLELWEHNVAARLGLQAALRYALDLGIPRIAATVTARATHLRDGLTGVPGVECHDLGPRPCGLVSFTVRHLPADQVRDALAAQDITVTVSRLPSTRYDMTRRGLGQVVRASPHYFVSDEQLDMAVSAVAHL
ncbi:aminotransferase class V-fold PLP-dependent enzyme [Actinokineospora enzanensis]|uniref:aminotransferase class V-fold PLP-dependent enzyme n=1 Tax=Actinokineospora enzanensis TaxID=155975 RepID=UPI0003A49282|nr:aminotransferase class V-fold PLP-dependent enzyme [Actinokineospora enzanensis]